MSEGIEEEEGNMSEGESSETSEDGYIEQSFEVKVYSTKVYSKYATFGHLKSILDTMVGNQGVLSHLCRLIY